MIKIEPSGPLGQLGFPHHEATRSISTPLNGLLALKLGNFRVIFPNVQKIPRVQKNIGLNKHNHDGLYLNSNHVRIFVGPSQYPAGLSAPFMHLSA